MRCDLYPMRPQLKQLFAGAGIVEYDANTVGVWAEKLFSGSIEIEPILGISDVLLGDLTVDPDVFAAIAPDALREEAHRCAVILSVANRFGPEEILRAHAMAVRAAGVRNVIVAPLGFISDHLEVLYDLDTEAQALAGQLGMRMVRAATVGTQPIFVGMLRQLIAERLSRSEAKLAIGEFGPNHDVCPADCCPAPQRAGRPPASEAPGVSRPS